MRKKLGGEVVGVCLDTDLAAARAAMERLGNPFRSAADGTDWSGPCAKSYGVRALPTSVLVGPDGMILRRRAYVWEYLADE
ncbi:MAG: TlpA family protein disulfide reductase [Planctomycetota bacterium]